MEDYMAFEVRKFPEKSWSISKMKVIENCYRQYYYTYYGSHNGWLQDNNNESKIAWRLKKLTNIWLLFGEKLHEVISANSKNFSYNFVVLHYLNSYLPSLKMEALSVALLVVLSAL